MTSANTLQAQLAKLYRALARGDLATWAAMHSDNVVFNVNGTTAVSGRTEGKQAMLLDILPRLFIGINWKCMCAEGNRATVIFEGQSETLEGAPYNNRYLHILEFDSEGLIQEVWEFFDTALAENILFTAEQKPPAGTANFRY